MDVVDIKKRIGYRLVVAYVILWVTMSGGSFLMALQFSYVLDLSHYTVPLNTFIPMALGIVLAYLYLKKWVLDPVDHLLTVSREISRGKLEVGIMGHRTQELNALARVLRRLRNSIRIAKDMNLLENREKKKGVVEKLQETLHVKWLFSLKGMVIWSLAVYYIAVSIGSLIIPILLGSDLESVWLFSLLSLIIINLIAAVIILAACQYFIVRPIGELVRAGERASLGEDFNRVTIHGPVEIVELAFVINEMISDIKRAMKIEEVR